jgi:predicted nucleic acid-binding protein
MPSVYLETTIPSYLVSRPSRDLITAAHQQITHEWWERARASFEIFVSEAVLEEIRAGDRALSVRRLELVEDLPVLTLSAEVRELVRLYTGRLGLPEQAFTDVLHIAFAVAYQLDYLVTWNCRHIANGRVIHRLASVNREVGRPTPIIVTPEELS